ncbi:carbamoyltransferase HypF [Gemmatimonas sp.]|uniref:carbamoyltransferase HypF n=1 Tax=Gemmatimonas sp. TaxID=1962908 RepID=UPI003340755B
MFGTSPPSAVVTRRAVRVRGGVQGVGFRPFVHGLAGRFHLHGFVGNDSDGVFIEVEGPLGAISGFLHALRTDAPPLARIDAIDDAPLPTIGAYGFAIVDSRRDPAHITPVAPDVATCADCLRELSDPADRRHRYPFINCTNCGPRYSIVTALPYDRASTTMAGFTMCVSCATEYANPADRRFHAQPNACPDCGPSLSWCDGVSGRFGHRGEEALAAALAVLTAGGIVAVQGIGGFHLACRADDDAAVRLLRERKHRPQKPLAVLVRDVKAAGLLARILPAEAELLSSPAHPIVLLERRPESGLSPSVAPDQTSIGVMLAYAPLHHLLAEAGPLVFTSGNLADEPIAFTTDDALQRFAGLVDGLLCHDRPINAPADDSVMRVALGAELPIRRSRGYAPYPVSLPASMRPVLAVGGELKATVCLVRDAYAFLSPHIGDVENLETERALTRTVEHLQQLFGVRPELVAADQSPVYRSALWAGRFAAERGLRLVRVQHHHAHVASLMAEHGLRGDAQVLGVAFDGTGYGTDGTIWGGEFLLADYRRFTRVAHFAPTQLAGGDMAVRHPSRLALAHLHAVGIPWSDDLPPVRALGEEARRILRQQFERQLHTSVTTSAGRLLDACAALCGVRQSVSYEGQAAIEFELLATQAPRGVGRHYPITVVEPERDGAPLQLAFHDFWREVVIDLRQGRDRRSIALDVHRALADVIVTVAQRVRDMTETQTVGLTGGVFQNVLLLTLAVQRLQQAGFTVLTHRAVPPNDGGLALGQAVVAAQAEQP